MVVTGAYQKAISLTVLTTLLNLCSKRLSFVSMWLPEGMDFILYICLVKLIRKLFWKSYLNLIYSWMLHTVEGFIRNFIKGYVIRFSLSLLISIIKRKLSLKYVLWQAISKPMFTFSVFVGLLWATNRFVIWLLRRIRKKDDKYNSIIAGLLSSLSVLVEPDLSTRKLIVLYTFARSLESFILTLDSNKIMKEPPHWNVALYWFMISFFVFHTSANPDVVGRGIVNLVNKVGCQKPNDRIIVENIFHEINKLY